MELTNPLDIARSKDHERDDPSIITTTAVGIKMLNVGPPPQP
jgi:hypothetical protein